MEFLNTLIDAYNIPLLTAFLLGVLMSISPCPLATNITAIAYISRELKTVKNTLLNGLLYTLGRGVSYTALAFLIYFGFSSFQISRIFQGWGDKVLGLVLIFLGLVMFGVIKINWNRGGKRLEKAKEWLSRQGLWGSFALGILFALAFCPYSGVLFFGVLMPLILKTSEGLILPLAFAIGTGLPVILFSILLAFSIKKISQIFQVMQKAEKIIRYAVAFIFILTGIYYTQYLVKFLLNL